MKYLLLLLLVTPCFATTRYVAASAGTFSGGSACNGHTAITPSTFNSTTLAAGDITYVCGTITASGGGSLLTIGNNGSSGNVIQLVFDTGAVMSAPYFSAASGAITVNGNYVTIDGGTNGVIKNTANGTSLANQQASRLIQWNGNNGTVKNLTIGPVYVHVSGDINGGDSFGIYARGISNFYVGPGNAFSGGDVCLLFLWDGGESNLTIDGNDFTTCNQSIEQGTSNNGVTSFTNTTVKNNTASAWSNWDEPTDSYHHNFYHPFTNRVGSSLVGTLQVYNNRLEGDIGQFSTSFIFIENNNGGLGGTMDPFYIFNNIFHKTNHVGTGGSGLVAPTSDNGYLINNTFYDDDTSGNSYIAFHPYSGGWHSENNIFVQNGMFALVDVNLSTTNYNDYYLGQQSNPWKYVATNAANLAAWRTACSCDANAISTNPNLNTTTWVPNSGSPVIGTGTNLTSLGITALDTDFAGVARPSSGAWDMGAIQFAAPTTYTLTVTATNGSVSGTNCATGTYNSGDSIGACTATASGGYTFTGWSGTGSASAVSGTGTASFTITANSTLTATFTATGSTPVAPTLLRTIN